MMNELRPPIDEIEAQPSQREGKDQRAEQANIPSELMAELEFDKYQREVRQRFSMYFLFNGKPFHFDGVVRAIAAAHKAEKTEALERFSAIQGTIHRICVGFGQTTAEKFTAASLVSGSKSWQDYERDE